jgi:hypothetical protein
MDPRTGEMVFFGYAAKGETTPDIAYYEADPDGRIVHETWVRAPYSSMVHDWAVTQNFVVFPIIPMRSEYAWLQERQPHFQWDPDREVYLGVLPRKGSADEVRWLRGSNRFASHILGAWDDGRRIHIETPVGQSNFFPFFPDVTGAPYDPVRARGHLSRWTIDMGSDSGTFTEERLTDVAGEFPRMDDRFETLPYRRGFLALNHVPGDPRPGAGFRWIGAFDTTGARPPQVFYPGDDCSVAEPLFVPGNDDAPEGHGYVFVVVGRHQEMRSDLVILDARRHGGAAHPHPPRPARQLGEQPRARRPYRLRTREFRRCPRPRQPRRSTSCGARSTSWRAASPSPRRGTRCARCTTSTATTSTSASTRRSWTCSPATARWCSSEGATAGAPGWSGCTCSGSGSASRGGTTGRSPGSCWTTRCCRTS